MKKLALYSWFFLNLAMLWGCLVIALAAKPITPPPPKKADQYQYPDLNCESNWGKMSIDRNNGDIIIVGHPIWDAEARFVTKDKVYVWWTHKETGRPAPGIYVVQPDGTLHGFWGWDNECLVDENTWQINGDVKGDRIYPVKSGE